MSKTQPRNTQTRTAKTRQHLSPLVLEALDWINENQSNNVVNGCFHKEYGQLKTFGVYNVLTKKYAIYHPENFFPEDFQDIKMVALTKKR